MGLKLCIFIPVVFLSVLAVGGTSSILEMSPPISGLTLANLRDTFEEFHNGHRHEAIDIMEPRGTPVRAVVPGTIQKLFFSIPGGSTIYQFDEVGEYCYYYAHLDRYAEGLHEGMPVRLETSSGLWDPLEMQSKARRTCILQSSSWARKNAGREGWP